MIQSCANVLSIGTITRYENRTIELHDKLDQALIINSNRTVCTIDNRIKFDNKDTIKSIDIQALKILFDITL